jgi:hypothetical protein
MRLAWILTSLPQRSSVSPTPPPKPSLFWPSRFATTTLVVVSLFILSPVCWIHPFEPLRWLVISRHNMWPLLRLCRSLIEEQHISLNPSCIYMYVIHTMACDIEVVFTSHDFKICTPCIFISFDLRGGKYTYNTMAGVAYLKHKHVSGGCTS